MGVSVFIPPFSIRRITLRVRRNDEEREEHRRRRRFFIKNFGPGPVAARMLASRDGEHFRRVGFAVVIPFGWIFIAIVPRNAKFVRFVFRTGFFSAVVAVRRRFDFDDFDNFCF